MPVSNKNEPKISVLPLQKAFLTLRKKGLTAAEIAARCDYIRSDGRGDGQSLQRAIGLYPYTRSPREGGGNYFTQYVGLPVAVKIFRGFNVDPVEIEL